MRDTLVHRGPDDAGTWASRDGTAWLAMRRLAVVDLSPAGHQPMSDASGLVHVVLNGEIYNHVDLRDRLRARGHNFRGHSDTEVLLAAYLEWGREFLRELNGMFAVALHDARDGSLLLARDRAGEKPLFYYVSQGRVIFASELKALLEDPSVPRAIDGEALDRYLAYGYVPMEQCILSGVRKLPQATAAVFDVTTGAMRTWTYWELPEANGNAPVDEAELEHLVEELLRDSVRLRLQADVPVGMLLSGGLDSSLLTALAAEVSSGAVRTFTISFPGHAALDEGPYARIVASHFGTNHVELEAAPADLVLIHDLARQFDEPIADSSMIPTFLVSRLVRQHATVALVGDGGDELFGGYHHYSWLQQQQRMAQHVPQLICRFGARVAERLPLGLRGRNYVLGLAAPDGVAHVNVYFDAAARRQLLPAARVSVPAERWKSELNATGDLVDRATRTDFSSYLVDDILVKVDRASMLTSLEVRAPFLDHRLVEVAFRDVPSRLKATETDRKILLRRIGQRLLPSELDLTRKQGFSLPLDAWLRGPWRGEIEQVLLDDAALFDRATVRSLLDGHARGRANAQRIFALWIFELWRANYCIDGVAHALERRIA